MDWVEIRDMLGLNITPDQLRKQAVGYEEYDNYINGFDGVTTTILTNNLGWDTSWFKFSGTDVI